MAASFRVLMPAHPIALGSRFQLQVERAGDQPLGVVALVGRVRWKGRLREHEESFFERAPQASQRTKVGSDVIYTFHFEAPTEPPSARGERLSVDYVLRIGGERSEAQLALIQPPMLTRQPPLRARFVGEAGDAVELSLASRVIPIGDSVLGELSVEGELGAAEPRISLVVSEELGDKRHERALAEVVLPRERLMEGRAQRFRMAMPSVMPPTLRTTRFAFGALFRVEVPLRDQVLRFDVPLQAHPGVPVNEEVPPVGRDRRQAALVDAASAGFRQSEREPDKLVGEFGRVRARVRYETTALAVELRFPPLGIDTAYTEARHRAHCQRELFRPLDGLVRLVDDERAELRIPLEASEQLPRAMESLVVVMNELEARRAALPAPRAHRSALRHWRHLAEHLEGDLAPAGPRLDGRFRGRPVNLERMMHSGFRLSLWMPVGVQPEIIVSEAQRALADFHGLSEVVPERFTFICMHDLGSDEISLARMLELITRMDRLIRAQMDAGPYR